MMRFWKTALMTAAGLLATGSAYAQVTITDLFNTGTDASNNKRTVASAPGPADLHYTEIANNIPPRTEPQPTFVMPDGSRPGSYITAADSNYITIDTSDGSSVNGGNYQLTYRTTFTLPANADLSSVSIAGGWSIDNVGSNILINGFSAGISSTGFSAFSAFTIPGGHYVVGTNNLDFVWTNQGGPGAINVRFTTKQFNTLVTATPEPGSLALLVGLAVSGSAFAFRRKTGYRV